MSKNIRQSVKVKGQNRPIPFPTPEPDKRKARKIRRRLGKHMTEKLNSHVPGSLLFPVFHSIDFEEQVKLGNIDIGHLTWDGPAEKIPGFDIGHGLFRTRKPSSE